LPSKENLALPMPSLPRTSKTTLPRLRASSPASRTTLAFFHPKSTNLRATSPHNVLSLKFNHKALSLLLTHKEKPQPSQLPHPQLSPTSLHQTEAPSLRASPQLTPQFKLSLQAAPLPPFTSHPQSLRPSPPNTVEPSPSQPQD
jgi:hypothetical protein